MPEDTFGADDDLRELDFEGQAGATGPAASDEGAPAPSPEQVAEPTDDDSFWENLPGAGDEAWPEQTGSPTAGYSDEETWAALQQLAEDDPLAAADVLAQVRTAQVEARMQQMLEPVLQRERHETSANVAAQIRAEFPHVSGQDLAAIVEADPNRFLGVDPGVQLERLRDAAELLSLRSRAAYERGDDVVAGIDNDASQYRPDSFGNEAAAAPTRDAAGRFVQSTGQRRPVHVEGGSGPQPSMPVSDVDPIIAEIDEVGGGSDAFGPKRGL
jgi:hypothetical protein